MTDELTQLVGTSTEAAKAGDWYKAEKYINKAIKTWKSKDSYTHIVLRHSEIDILSDALYEYMRDVLEKNEDTATASSKKLLYHLESLAQMERLRFGSIFSYTLSFKSFVSSSMKVFISLN